MKDHTLQKTAPLKATGRVEIVCFAVGHILTEAGPRILIDLPFKDGEVHRLSFPADTDCFDAVSRAGGFPSFSARAEYATPITCIGTFDIIPLLHSLQFSDPVVPPCLLPDNRDMKLYKLVSLRMM